MCCEELRDKLLTMADELYEDPTKITELRELHWLRQDLEIYCETAILERHDHHAPKLVALILRPVSREFAQMTAEFSKEKWRAVKARAEAVLGLNQS